MKKILLLVATIFTMGITAQNINGVAIGTTITLADGTEKLIEEVKKDDLLLSLNEEGTSVIISRVTGIEQGTEYKLIKVVLADGSELTITPNHPLLSSKGWASSDSNATKLLKIYENAKIQNYQVDSFIYTLNASSNIEVLPIIEVEEIVENTLVFKLQLDSEGAFIANGVFIGQ